LVVGKLKTVLRRDPDTDDGPGPRYGTSVNYLACRECGEGSMVYDEDRGASVCQVCGAVDEGP
jgi:rubredoxin